MSKKNLTAEQARALEIMLSGENVFLSGEGGTGKSFVLREFLNRCKTKNVVVCAPTGIAAVNVNGATLHRVFGVPLNPIGPDAKIRAPRAAVKKADVIVIDEISMCRFDVFEYVARSIRMAESAGKKKQLIVVGDFFQLPPVIDGRDRGILESLWGAGMVKDGYAFQAPSWSEFQFRLIELHEPLRQQDDAELVAYLNAVRRGDKRALGWFNANHNPTEQDNGIFLFPTNREADALNAARIAALKTEPREYVARIDGTVKENEMPTSQLLVIKPGMRVMSLLNSVDEDYQNGSLGTVVSTDETSVEVKFDNGNTVNVKAADWDVCDYEIRGSEVKKKTIGTFTQLPLKPAYAITIHKAQGQTYDKVNVNPRCFTTGQLYVALSRCRSTAGLHLTTMIYQRYLVTSPDVVDFYAHGVAVGGQLSLFSSGVTPDSAAVNEAAVSAHPVAMSGSEPAIQRSAVGDKLSFSSGAAAAVAMTTMNVPVSAVSEIEALLRSKQWM